MSDPISTEVSITMGRTSSTRDDGKNWMVRIQDNRSRAMIMELFFDNDTFADMMSSTSAGHYADAELWQLPHHGKYALHRSLDVVATRFQRPHLDEEMKQAAERLLRIDPILSEDRGWHYAGFSGGGGGSRYRTLRFVRYTDEEPTDAERKRIREEPHQ